MSAQPKRIGSNPPPPKGRKPQPSRVRYARIDDVLADVRDRLKANDVAGELAAVADLGTLALRVESLARDAQAAGNEPHHVDFTVACDFRETMLQVAGIAASAVLEIDRRTVKPRAGEGTR